MNRRTAVTGYGLLTAAGADAAATWESVRAGRSAVARVTAWDVTGWPWTMGAEIRNADPRKLIADRKLLKVISKADVFGLNAVTQAVAHSGMLAWRETLADPTEFNDRTGVYTGAPGIKYYQQYDYLPTLARSGGDMRKFGEGVFTDVHPMWLLQNLPNNVLAYTGIQYGFKGPNENVTNHSVGSTQALVEAHRAISEGSVDRAVVAGYESGIEPEGFAYYGAMGFLSREIPRPFDKDRDGTVLAQGAGALVLESLDSARARNATVYGEILGAATTSEAQGVFALRPDGDGETRAIRLAIEDADLAPRDVGMVVAHGNGTLQSDASEAGGIVAALGDVPVTAFKWCVGHTLAAAGTVETVLALLALREGRVPAVATLREKAPECRELRVSAAEQEARTRKGLVVSRAFAGLTTCVAISAEVT